MEQTAAVPASTSARDVPADRPEDFEIRWVDNVPFWGVHIAAVVGVILLGFSWSGLALALSLHFIRMFGITGAYHRYFSHRTYKTSRVMQFLLGLLGATAVQKGPLWWASHHRRHHKYSDEPEDVHSVRQRGFWWSHCMWILVKRHNETEWDRIPDLAKYPELRLLDKYHVVLDVGIPVALYFIGGFHALVWGSFVSTVLLWHGTFTINSLAHLWGSRRYETTDDSRNNALLALLTLGEGWHNNHHHYQRSTAQGFYWWEIDITYYILKAMSWVGLVWDIQSCPKHVRDGIAKPKREALAAATAARDATAAEPAADVEAA